MLLKANNLLTFLLTCRHISLNESNEKGVKSKKKHRNLTISMLFFGGRGGTWIRKLSYYPLLKFVIPHCFIWFFKLFVLFCVIVFPLELSSKGKYKGKLCSKKSPHSRYNPTLVFKIILPLHCSSRDHIFNNICPIRTVKYDRKSRATIGNILTVQYIAKVSILYKRYPPTAS